MRTRSFISSSIFTLILVMSLPVRAQITTAAQTPDQKPRKVKSEPSRVFKDWPVKDVRVIITRDELKAYEKLETDEERAQFIDHFWAIRDPDPDTAENEYKEAFYERLAYADEHFSSGKPGRLTDRGRIYVKFGKPDSIESHPAGGPYERMPYEGGGSTSTYPFERWFYRYIPEVSSDVELEFVDPTGSGEYRLARNFDEKDALLYVPGAGRTLAEIFGSESKADRITGVGGFGRTNYQRQKDSPFEVLNMHTALERVPETNRNYFGSTRLDTPITEDDPLDIEVQSYFFRQSDNQVLTAFTIQADNRDLVFKDSGGIQIAKLNISGRVSTITQRSAARFEDVVETTALPEELIGTKQRRSAYSKSLILGPGRYRLDVMVRDVESGATAIRHHGFEVPRYGEDLATSSIVLAAKLERVGGKDVGNRFVIGQTKVIPNLSGDYTQGQPVGVYLQAYNVGIDQTTLQPAVDVEYVLLRDGKILTTQKENWKGAADPGQRLTLARLIDTQGLVAGDYEVRIQIRDHVTGKSLSPSARFRLLRPSR
jgi:GWxTD domain-containing protein